MKSLLSKTFRYLSKLNNRNGHRESQLGSIHYSNAKHHKKSYESVNLDMFEITKTTS